MTFSCFLTEVHDSRGGLKYESGFRHNLTTDSASGYTNRRDWQAKAMGRADIDSDFAGTATASSASSLTNSGATFPTSGQALAGQIVACGPNSSGTGSTVFGVIISNTATVLTVDQWYNPGTLAAGTTPNSTATYQILPGQMPACYLAVTEDTGAPAATDTYLQDELTADGFSRAIGTWAHTAAATTYTLQNVFTASGTRTIEKEAVFGAQYGTANTNDGGVMPFESLEPNPPTLVSGDTLTQTVTVTIN